MVQDGFEHVGELFATGNYNQVGQAFLGNLSDATGQSEGLCAFRVARRRIVPAGVPGVFAREGTHFREHVQLRWLFAVAFNAGETVGAEADVDAGGGQFLQGKLGDVRRTCDCAGSARRWNGFAPEARRRRGRGS